MSRGRAFPIALLAAGLLLALLALWKTMSDRRPAPPPPETAGAEEQAPDAAQEEEVELAPLRRQSVLVYFPGVEADGLVGEEREIFGTAAPGDRAKQILSDVLAGPAGAAATRAVPHGTQLRQVYVLDNGVAYIDFSEDLRRGLGGGSSAELLTVYAIVNSVALNVSEIKKVGILIEGRPVDTLNGHMDLRRPLPPNRSYFATEKGDDGSIIVSAERR